ncbi:hypothetical protein AAG906_040485 [Vitis piasezkii]
MGSSMPYPGGFYSPLAPSLPATLGTYSQWGRPGFTRTLGCSSQDSSLGQWGSPLELSLGRCRREWSTGFTASWGLGHFAWEAFRHLLYCLGLKLPTSSGIVNVFQGFEVMGSSRSYAKLAYCLSLATLIGICIASEVNSWVIFCRKAKEETMRREGLIGGSEKGSGRMG